MSRNYDNWERLVAAVLDREKLRDLARAPSLSSSFSSITSDLSLDYSLSNLSVRDVQPNGARSPPPSSELLVPSHLVPQDPISPRWSGEIVTPNLKVFTLAELRSATREFERETMLGKGSFGTIYKGYIDEKTYGPSRFGIGMPIAVKKSHQDREPVQLNGWKAEVKFSHPNLIKLLGYCLDNRHVLLVYEYMPKGSLGNRLFRSVGESISWDIRIKIATGATQALAFLHNTEEQVIYRDFKASHILLDGGFNAKLSDFRLARSGPVDGDTHVTTEVMSTHGYAAPEYVATGHLYVKSDVYGFGVVLLEIITGPPAMDRNRPQSQTNLVEWVKPFLSNPKQFKKFMDPRILGQIPPKAAYQVAELILSCLVPDPKNRPNMDEVSDILEQISIIKTKPKDPEMKSKSRDGQNQHHAPPLPPLQPPRERQRRRWWALAT